MLVPDGIEFCNLWDFFETHMNLESSFSVQDKPGIIKLPIEGSNNASLRKF